MKYSLQIHPLFNQIFKPFSIAKILLLTLSLLGKNAIGQAYFNNGWLKSSWCLGKNEKVLNIDFDYDGNPDFLHYITKTFGVSSDTLFFNRNLCNKINPIFISDDLLDFNISGTNANFLNINSFLKKEDTNFIKYDFVMYDLDGDGDLDFIRSTTDSINSTIDFYKNNGLFPNYQFDNLPLISIYLPNKDVRQIELEDINNDHKLDLIILSDKIYLYTNTGTSQLPSFNSLNPDSILLNSPGFEVSNIQMTDVDKDSMRDLVILGNEKVLYFSSYYYQPKIEYYKKSEIGFQNELKTFLKTKISENSIKFNTYKFNKNKMYLFDIDLDNDLDLYTNTITSDLLGFDINYTYENLQYERNQITFVFTIDVNNNGSYNEVIDDYFSVNDSVLKTNNLGSTYYEYFTKNIPRLLNLNLKIQPLNQSAILGNLNYSQAFPDNGTYIITAPILRNFTVTPEVLLLNLYSTEKESKILEFKYKPILNRKDLSVTLFGLPPVPGKINYKQITYKNLVSTKQDGVVKYKLENGETFISSNPAPSAINGKTYSWNFSNLEAFEKRKITLSILLDQNIPVNTEIKSYTEILLSSGTDFFKRDNKDTLVQKTVAAFESFGKLISSNGDTNITLTNLTLPHEFTIYFQNTNLNWVNTIQIADTLDANYDLNTFQMIDASHPSEVENKNNKVLRWKIDANLPPSNLDDINSRGYVKYKITPKSNTPVGTIFNNKASICLDCALTNTNQTAIIYNVISGIFDHQNQTELNITTYPNPAKTLLTFKIESPNKEPLTITIFNLKGEEILCLETTNGDPQINISQFANGLYLYTIEGKSSFGKGKFVKE